MNKSTANRRSDLEMGQMKWCVENVKRALTKFVVSELYFLEWIFFVDDDKSAGKGRRSKRIIDEPCLQHLIGRQQMSHFPDFLACGSVHTRAPCAESCCVRENGGLHR